jgi:translation initiation factor IF-2
MPQLFRVGDLARQMNLPVEELVFKLRSIGVDISKPEDTLDLATVKSIITGETLQRRPREVIVRKEPTAAEEQKKAPAPAVDRLKRRRPTRRSVDEELPDEVPNLAAMSLPASQPAARPPGATIAGDAASAEGATATAATGLEPPPAAVAPAPVTATPIAAVTSEPAHPVAAPEVAPERAPEAAAEKPTKPKRGTKAAAKKAAEAETQAEAPAPGAFAHAATPAPPAKAAHAAEHPPVAEKPATKAAAAKAGAAKAAAAAPAPVKTPAPAREAAKTPLESQLRELSDEEVKARIMAAKQAAQQKATEKTPATPRGKTSRKAKSAADADEIRDLLAKFEESKVRAKSDGPAAPTTTSVPQGRGRQVHRQRRERGEAPTAQRAITVEFRDGQKPEGPVYLSEAVTVRELAEKLNVLVKDLMAYLISKKIFVVANQALPQELAEQICEELGIEAMVISFEEEIDLEQEEAATGSGTLEPRPPVVTVMGHVDHGKTSLLDAIRSTRVAVGEAGGITQHIGASRVVHNGKPIVFIDTPGHEAFTQMRARGAKITDIVVLVVAADDGVMPQTVEAISHARAARVPIIVAVNKIDKPGANADRIKQALASHEVLVEGWGGEVPVAEVSALKNIGINDLLDVILLVAEMQNFRATQEGPARGTVLEARKERGRGVVATVLVQQGTLAQGDYFFAGATYGRVRAMVDTARKPLRQAGPTDAAEIMGLENIPDAGDTFQVVENEARAREVASYRKGKQREEQMAAGRKVSLEGLMDKIKSDEVKALNVVLKADVQGSVEVLRETLVKLSTDEVAVNLIHASAGAINANDILLASASQAVVIGFNVRPERSAKELADREGVDVRLYTVIYHLTEDIQKAMVGLLKPTFREEDLGHAEVRKVFKVTKVGTIAGCMVTGGVIQRSAKARLLRDNVVVWEGGIASLRREKDDASEVKNGFECGIGLERFQDIKEGDVIESYRTVEVAREM